MNIGPSDFLKITKALGAEDFWKLGNVQTGFASDGTQLLLEVNDHGRYHAVYSNGAVEGPLQRLARVVLMPAHLHLPGE